MWLRLAVSALANGLDTGVLSVFCATMTQHDGWGPVVRGVSEKSLNGGRVKELSSARVRALARACAELDVQLADEVDAAAGRCFLPVRIQISGRTGVGKSTVRGVLSGRREFADENIDFVEAASMDVPGSPDPLLDGDVVVHVLAGGVHTSDVDAVASLSAGPAGLVVVLGKADSLDALGTAVEQATLAVGASVHPLMSTIAAGVGRGLPSTFDPLRPLAHAVTDEILSTPERFLAAELPLARRTRASLVDTVETFGVAAVVRVLVTNPAADDVTLRLMLAEKSGVDDVARAVRAAVDGARARRAGALVHRLTELCTLYPGSSSAIDDYVASDEAVVATMRSNLHVLGESEIDTPTHRTVQLWQDRFGSAPDAPRARAALAVARGYMRLVTR